MADFTVIPDRPWSRMTDQELARELRMLPQSPFVTRFIKAIDDLQEQRQVIVKYTKPEIIK